MTEAERRRKLSRILTTLAEELDVPPSKYEDAKERYDAVGNWLNEDDSELAPYNPEIYAHGSFALGTAVRPLGDDDYDVDAVCLLQLDQGEVNQRRLKDMVGGRLKGHRTYARMLDPKEGGRRCWTLKYADESKFHLDILPAIPDDYDWLIAIGVPPEHAQHAVCITDKETWNTNRQWPRSNPKGYAEWFKERMRVLFEQRRRILALEKRATVDDIPDYEVRTPLQRVIQLLKRHRDMRYSGDDDKPISIIITTLAARAYNNEDDIAEALLNVVPGMRRAIENRDGIWWVPNPVNPRENFADKWAETPRKRDVFFEWLEAIEQEHDALLTDRGFTKVGEYLAESYGQRDASEAMTKYARKTGRTMEMVAAKDGSSVLVGHLASLSRVSHREAPPWPMRRSGQVTVSGRYRENGRWYWFASNASPLPKGCDLIFHAKTDTPAPFSVYWQVVNTGAEAERANGLRGTIFASQTAGVGGLRQKEETAYKGTHWIECFIVRDDRCVARSGEFVVNIA